MPATCTVSGTDRSTVQYIESSNGEELVACKTLRTPISGFGPLDLGTARGIGDQWISRTSVALFTFERRYG